MFAKCRSPNARRARSGAAAVELALLLPVLITIVLGAVDFGRFAYTYISISNAAREGASMASRQMWTTSTNTIWKAGVQAAVQDELGCFDTNPPFVWQNVQLAYPTTSSVTEGGKTFTCPYIKNMTTGEKTVGISVSYPFHMLVNWPFLPASVRSFTVERTVYMRMIP